MKRNKNKNKNKNLDTGKCLKINYSIPVPTLTDNLSQHFVQPAANMKECTRDDGKSDSEIFSDKNFAIVTLKRQEETLKELSLHQDMLRFSLRSRDKSLSEKEKNNQTSLSTEFINFSDQTGNKDQV